MRDLIRDRWATPVAKCETPNFSRSNTPIPSKLWRSSVDLHNDWMEQTAGRQMHRMMDKDGCNFSPERWRTAQLRRPCVNSKFEFEYIQTFSSLERFDFQSIPRWLTWYIYVVARRWSSLRIPLWISRPKPWPRWIIWHFLNLTKLLPVRVKQHQFSCSINEAQNVTLFTFLTCRLQGGLIFFDLAATVPRSLCSTLPARRTKNQTETNYLNW